MKGTRKDQTVNTNDSSSNQAGESSPGGFDIDRIRLGQDFAAMTDVKKAITTVPVRKPSRQEFVRTHPSDDWGLQTGVIELTDERETYVVDRSLWDDVGTHLIPKRLVTTITRQGVLFLWPLRLPDLNGRSDNWSRSAMEAAEMAREAWVSVRSNMSLRAYEVFRATGEFSEPEWPELTFDQLLQVAFKDRFIHKPDHPVLRQLRGEI